MRLSIIHSSVIEVNHRMMSDYSKQTVAQLRQLLKDRSIPSTGLTRKAQIIEKLEEADSAVAATIATESSIESADTLQGAANNTANHGDEDEADAKVEVPGSPVKEVEGIYTRLKK